MSAVLSHRRVLPAAAGAQARATAGLCQTALARLRRPAAGLLLPLLLLTLWQAATSRHWLPEQILPAPILVWRTLAELAQSGELWAHLATSLARIGWSLLIGGGGGLLLGLAMGLSPQARAYLLPSFELLAQFPVVGWIPLLIIFVGIDEPLKISAISLAVVVPVTVSTLKGIAQLPVALLEVARVHRFSRLQVACRVALPAAAPTLFNGLRQGVMQAWLALVFVELLASSEGIGYLMVWGRQLLQMDLVVVGMVVIGCVGVALDVVLRAIESRLLRWRRVAF
jgi:sulfonate transport system permease protein